MHFKLTVGFLSLVSALRAMNLDVDLDDFGRSNSSKFELPPKPSFDIPKPPTVSTNGACLQQLEQIIAENNFLKQENYKLKGENQHQAGVIHALKHENKDLQNERDHLKSQIETLIDKLKDAKSLVNSREVGQRDSYIQKLEDRLGEYEKKISELITDNKSLFKDNQSFNELLMKLKENLKNAEQMNQGLGGQIDKLKEEKFKLIHDNKELVRLVGEWEGKFKNLEKELQGLKGLSAEYEKIRVEFEGVNEEREAMLKEIEALRAEVKELTASLQSLKEDNQLLFADNKSLNANNSKLLFQIKGLKFNIQTLKSELEQAQDTIKNWEAKFMQLQQINESLEERLESYEKANFNEDKYRAQINSMKEIIAILEAQIKNFEDDRRGFSSKFDEFNKQMRSLNDEILRLSAENEELRVNCTMKNYEPSTLKPFVPEKPDYVPSRPTKYIGSSLSMDDLDDD